ncbi:hypothetical protein [Nocardia bovistercoris]|uniref:Uncharacterized protein n=1 Tax=Nocardia bovistercoris TaxID=2785916 RepID=A0A931N0I5_9NOCA|nr:hypothetical protein [Nocardia bovistercoris]MBH0774712.1 hypothetical protein [Nocardia bovistercoris]
MAVELITARSGYKDRWTAVPFIALTGIIAVLTWRTDGFAHVAVIVAMVGVMVVQTVGVVVGWQGTVSERQRNVLIPLLLLAATGAVLLAFGTSADTIAPGMSPLFAGLVAGLLLQCHLLRRAARSRVSAPHVEP